MQGLKAAMSQVSICIPTFNGQEYISEALTSILNQTLKDFELVIVDDCSTDLTVQIIQTFDDPRIRFYQNPRNLGLVGNWNRCIELATTPYICIFHQDDVMMPENVEKKTSVLDENPNVGMVYSRVAYIDADGVSTGIQKEPEFAMNMDGNMNALLIIPGQEYWRSVVLGFRNPVCAPSVMIRRDCYQRLGNYDKRLPYACDMEMWLRIALFYDIAYVHTPLVTYRLHQNNESRKFVDSTSEFEQIQLAKKIAIHRFPGQIPNRRQLEKQVTRITGYLALQRANACLTPNNHSAINQLVDYAFKCSPFLVFTKLGIRMLTKRLLGKLWWQFVSRAEWLLAKTYFYK